MAIALEPRLLFVQFHIDTNCINAESELREMNTLEAWEADEVILPLILSETARGESLAGKRDDPIRHSRNRKRHSKANTHIFTIEESDESSPDRFHDVERALFPGGATTDNQKRDVRIVCEAQKYGAILVTNDGESTSQPGGIRGNRHKLKGTVEIMSPAEAVAYVRSKIKQRDDHNRRVVDEYDGELPSWTGQD